MDNSINFARMLLLH